MERVESSPSQPRRFLSTGQRDCFEPTSSLLWTFPTKYSSHGWRLMLVERGLDDTGKYA